MARDVVDDSTIDKLPLVAVGYGPRCVPVMQLTEAAAGLCELLWMIDGSLPEMREMTELLNRFGPVVNIAGLGVEQLLGELSSPYRPDAIVTYLDANMTLFARVAETLELPFHTPSTAVALTDKAEQRRALKAAGLGVPACTVIPSGLSDPDVVELDREVGWPAVLKPRSAQGSRYTFYVPNQLRLSELLDDLGSQRPDMVLESYLADDPVRVDGPYADYVSVESVVAVGDISHLALTGRFPMAENFRETGFFIPAVLDDRDEAAVLNLATQAIEALGVTTGCLHTEIKFTPDGPRVIEVNGRVGGGVPEMLRRASGLSLVEMTLRLALGELLRFKGPVATDRIGFRFFLQPPSVSGTVATIDGIDAVSQHPAVDDHHGPPRSRCRPRLEGRFAKSHHGRGRFGGRLRRTADVNRLLHDEVTVTYADVGLDE